MNDLPGDLIGTTKAARLCGGVHVGTVHRWIQGGHLRGWKVRGRVYVSEAEARSLWEAVPTRKEKPAPKGVATKREMSQGRAWAKRVLAENGIA